MLYGLLNTGVRIPEYATIIPEADSLGHVNSTMGTMTKGRMKNDLAMVLSGRTAEEIKYGDDNFTTGCIGDLHQAHEGATEMIKEYGMSDEIGPVVFPKSDEKISEDLQERVERERENLLKNALSRSQDCLKQNIPALDALARALLEKRTIKSEEAKEIIAPYIQNQQPEIATPT